MMPGLPPPAPAEYIKTLHISPSAGNTEAGLGGPRNYYKYQIGNVIWKIFQVTPLEGKYICLTGREQSAGCRVRLKIIRRTLETRDPTQHNTFSSIGLLASQAALPSLSNSIIEIEYFKQARVFQLQSHLVGREHYFLWFLFYSKPDNIYRESRILQKYSILSPALQSSPIQNSRLL